MKEIVLKVEGMECGGCENRIKNAVSSIDGVENVVADYTTGIVTVTTKEKVSENIIKEKIDDIGFEVIE